MKKFVFFIFIVCVYTPSFADGNSGTCMPFNTTLSSDDRQYMKPANTDNYLQCGGTQKNNYQCKYSDKIAGSDGYIYECKNDIWEKIQDKSMDTCSLSPDANAGRHDIVPKDVNAPFVYEVVYYDDGAKIFSYCKYPRDKYEEYKKSTNDNGGAFISLGVREKPNALPNTASTQGRNGATESVSEQTNEEELNITGNLESECKKSGGRDYDPAYGCICDTENDHLVQDTRTYNNIEYSICRCVDGYKRKNTKTDEQGNIKYLATGECVPANDYETKQVPNTEKYRQDAENAYRNEYDNAQSWANKGVTGLSTLMTGEGAKMAAQAWAEQIADRDAETEMTDYLAGMRCEYGNGNTVKLGDETNLPGGNELANYYAEYKTLADKLKTTKAALNLRSGIEAEVLYDRAETGLYQYRVAEIATGDNVSLARALMNPDGDDATKWNAQKTATQNKLITGGVLAATGVVAGYAANQYVNRNHEKEYKDLTMTFTEIKEQIEQKYPEIFTPTQVKPVVVEVIENPEKPDEPTIVVEIPLSASEKTFNKNIGTTTFDSGFMTLTDPGKEALTTAVTDVVSSIKDFATVTEINITAIGYTDPAKINTRWVPKLTQQYIDNIGPLPDSYKGKVDENSELSEARAKMVTKFLTEQFNKQSYPNVQIIENASGKGDTDCQNKKPQEYSKCRKVEISIKVTGTSTESE